MKAVIYARFSSDRQREESIEGQIRECREYAERKGINIVGEYIDRALSASKDTEKRTDFLRMIADSAKGGFEIVLVWKLDRFARSRYDSSLYKSILKRNGVRVVSATEAISESPEGIILEALLEGMAEYYSAELSVKVKRGIKENALKGRFPGGYVPYGYAVGPDRKLIINEDEAEVVRYMFQSSIEGLTVPDLVDELKKKGVTTHRGKPFSLNNVYTILKNRKYTGEYNYCDVVIPDGIPAIISEELFENTQRKKVKNRKEKRSFRANERYILSGKVFCGDCGTKMVGESGWNRYGRTRKYYRCVKSKKREGCSRPGIRKHWLEDFVIERTVKVLMDDAFLKRLIDKVYDLQEDKSPEIELLSQKLDQIEKSLSNIVKAIEKGIDTEDIKKRFDELQAEKKTIESNILRAQQRNKRLSKEEITDYVYSFKYLDPKNEIQRIKLIGTFINSIYVYADRIIIAFNYKQDADVVMLDDIKEHDLDSPDICKNLSRDIIFRDKGFGVMVPIQYSPLSNRGE